MALLDGIAAALAGAVAPFYRNGILYRQGIAIDDGAGTMTLPEPTAESIKVQVEACTEAMRRADGFSDRDVRLIILSPGVPRPTTDDKAGLEGVTYTLASVGTDPAETYWDCRGRPL